MSESSPSVADLHAEIFFHRMQIQAHEMLFRWLFEERALEKGLDAREAGDEVRRVAASITQGLRRGFAGEEELLLEIQSSIERFADGLENRMEKYD